jgi:ribosomal protein L13
MAIKIYSDKTQKFYNSVEEANKAEFEAKEAENREKIRKEREAAVVKEKKEKEAAERKAMAAEVEEARKAMVAAQKAYREAIEKFVKRFGTYHYSTRNFEDVPTLFDVFDWLPKFF